MHTSEGQNCFNKCIVMIIPDESDEEVESSMTDDEPSPDIRRKSTLSFDA